MYFGQGNFVLKKCIVIEATLKCRNHPMELRPCRAKKVIEAKNGVKPWLVVSTPLKNISQIGSFPQVGVKIKNV